MCAGCAAGAHDWTLVEELSCLRQAFSIPVIQIVYETLKDQQEGKKGKTTIKTGASGISAC